MNTAMRDNDNPVKIYLKDYQAPSHWIKKTELEFDIFDTHTCVTSRLQIEKNLESSADLLTLNGEDLGLVSVVLDGVALGDDEYTLDDEQLSIAGLSGTHILEIKTNIKPKENTSLEGLYRSRLMYCTQCEAQGFRKITYYLDRPDVMSEFTTTVIADKKTCPILLSNGNEVARGDSEKGRHWVTWHDPHLKPAYLFALVAGELAYIDDHYKTMSGRDVLLRIFVEEKDLDKCDHAMQSLKHAMRWDETSYGREYDLDIFMIVAVDDFNMGAMENKGLNIFNTSCVLANPKTTTDAAFQRVEAVVAHEYFHNWSGNRVTCRDWFQLSLKEGFTVFRDAEFSADMGSRTVKRIEDVSLMRSLQFAEDGGPMAHPVQPDAFIEISNFYTLTIYEKGAEVVRMIHTLLGAEKFREGCDLYFERHDGQAVTIDDFVAAMRDVSGRNFDQFMLWYKQAGTPELKVTERFDEASEEYTLTFKQHCRPTPECEHKKPYLIPVSVSLIGEAGLCPLYLGEEGEADREDNTVTVLELTEAEQSFTFSQVKEKPVPSLLRNFTAPVKLAFRYSTEDLIRIVKLDTDGFCKWDAAQQLAINEINRVMSLLVNDPSPSLNPDFISTFKYVLNDDQLDPAMVAQMFELPSEKYLGELSKTIDVESIHFARSCVQRKLAKALKADFLSIYSSFSSSDTFSVSADAIAARSLKNMALHYLGVEGSDASRQLIEDQFMNASNMTDELAAFKSIVHSTKASFKSLKALAIERFYSKWKDEALVINNWLSVQASQPIPSAMSEVKALMQHEAFDHRNPNKLRSLVGAFCSANIINFHASSGAGYEFLADEIIKLNRSNPQIASRLLTPLTKWRSYDENRQIKMKAALERIKNTDALSKDVFEVLTKTLS